MPLVSQNISKINFKVNYPFNISKGGAILAPVGSSLCALKVGKTEENKA